MVLRLASAILVLSMAFFTGCRLTRQPVKNADRQSGSKEFEIPYDRQALADYLCVERSALSAEISKLIDKGVIESRKSHFKLL